MKRINEMLRRPDIWFWLTAVGMGLLYWQFNGLKEHNHIPEWLQAGGSVLAIIGVFWVGDSTRRVEQVQKRKAMGAVIQAVLDFSMRVRQMVRQSDAEARAVINNVYHREVTNALADALSRLPLHELGSPAAVQAVLNMHGQFAHFLPKVIEVFIAGPHNHPDLKDIARVYADLPMLERAQKENEQYLKQFRRLAENVLDRLDSIDRECDVCLRELGVQVAPAVNMKTVSD